MTTRQRKRTKGRHVVLPVICALVLVYFGFHAVTGDHGLVSMQRMHLQEAELKSDVEALREERRRLATRASLLRSESLDPDIIGERARQVLNLVGSREVVVLNARGR